MKTTITLALAFVSVAAVAHADGERLLAYEFAKKTIVNRMKSPSTAKVCPWGDLKIHDLRDVFRGNDPVEAKAVTGWIDASNSFGAILRDEWLVVLVDGQIVGYEIGKLPPVWAEGYVFGLEKTPAAVEARKKSEIQARANRMAATAMKPVVDDAERLARLHAEALGWRRSQLTKKEAEARAKRLVSVAMRRTKATGDEAKNAWIEAYVSKILAD